MFYFKELSCYPLSRRAAIFIYGRLVGWYGPGFAPGSATTLPADILAAIERSYSIFFGKFLAPSETPGSVHGRCAYGLWAGPPGFGLVGYACTLVKRTPTPVSWSIIHGTCQ